METIISKLFANVGAQLHVRTQKRSQASATELQAKTDELQAKSQKLRDILQSMANKDTVVISDAARVRSQEHSAAVIASDEDAVAAGDAVSFAESAPADPAMRQPSAPDEDFEGSPTIDTTQNAEQARLGTREAKDAEGARFDAVLAELRGKYDEKEAMARFNDFMRSEGYEIHENVVDTAKFAPGSKIFGGRTNVFVNPFVGDAAFFRDGHPFGARPLVDRGLLGPVKPKITMLANFRTGESNAANFNTASTLTGVIVNGEMRYEETTWAAYNAATNSDFADSMAFWKNRNVEELSAQAGFDMGEYVNNLDMHWGKAFAAESVSADLGGIMTGILGKAGITLEPDNNISMHLGYFENGDRKLYVQTDFGDAALREKLQSVIDDEVRKEPGILGAFTREDKSVEAFNLDSSEIPGNYSNGVQSNGFRQSRQFIMSGGQPSVVVMGSGLDTAQTGYTYIKKISSTFDVNADIVEVKGHRYTTRSDPAEYAAMKQIVDGVRDVRG